MHIYFAYNVRPSANSYFFLTLTKIFALKNSDMLWCINAGDTNL